MISNTAKQISSRQHIQRSQAVGQNGQRTYYNACLAAKIPVKQATNKQDMVHIDFIIKNGETVDVKGMKNTHKKGQILVEIKNVQGKEGWCNGSGSPRWIAFDFGAFFIHVNNAQLFNLVKKLCNLDNRVFKIDDALYKGYSRRDRDDLMTVVSLTDVIKGCEHWYMPVEPFNPIMEKILL